MLSKIESIKQATTVGISFKMGDKDKLATESFMTNLIADLKRGLLEYYEENMEKEIKPIKEAYREMKEQNLTLTEKIKILEKKKNEEFDIARL